MSGLRIALVTPEFVTEYTRGGGIGSFFHRLARAFREAGHEPEVFVTSREAPGVLELDGVPVHRVPPGDRRLACRALQRGLRLLGAGSAQPAAAMLANARALALALAERERQQPFDLVHSTDYVGAGLCVARSPRRPHVCFSSSVPELWARANRDDSPWRRWSGRLARASLRRADCAYAHSQFAARHFASAHGIEVAVLRPPVFLEHEPAPDPGLELPKRYLVHFGLLSGVKGTEDLARALPLAWREEPELSMVWAGRDRFGRLPGWREEWGAQRDRVTYVGELEKPVLYAVLRDADAAVLPSRADNLPNTVTESLLLGVPVIGSDGASIDEIVEHGVTGELVPIGDERALARALVRAWRHQLPARKGFHWTSDPTQAIDSLLTLSRGRAREIDSFAGVGGVATPRRPRKSR